MVKSAVEYLENLIVFVRLSEAASDLYILRGAENNSSKCIYFTAA
jgi:hypothetical protein